MSVTRDYWTIIATIKYPVMAGCEDEVRAVSEMLEQIRPGKGEANVYLFYRSRRNRRWVCAVSKQEGRAGFLIMAYPTDAIREGERISAKRMKGSMIKEHDRIVLKTALPAEGLEAGDVGTVVHSYRDGLAYEVEFTTLAGDTAAVVTVESSQVRPIHTREITHARELHAA